MATRTQIIELRLQITDPANAIRIYDLATTGDLPATPVPQTVYYVQATGLYYRTEKTSGAVVGDYSFVDLHLSDATLSGLIDELGAYAKKRALVRIAAKLGSQLQIVKTTSGAESMEFVSLLEAYRYYKALAADAAEETAEDNSANTGRFLRVRRPTIAGGNL